VNGQSAAVESRKLQTLAKQFSGWDGAGFGWQDVGRLGETNEADSRQCSNAKRFQDRPNARGFA
jgi:hypothetical protein